MHVLHDANFILWNAWFQPFAKQAEQNRKEYQDAMLKWEEKMLEEGRVDLIRGRKKKPAKKKARKRKTKKEVNWCNIYT